MEIYVCSPLYLISRSEENFYLLIQSAPRTFSSSNSFPTYQNVHSCVEFTSIKVTFSLVSMSVGKFAKQQFLVEEEASTVITMRR